MLPSDIVFIFIILLCFITKLLKIIPLCFLHITSKNLLIVLQDNIKMHTPFNIIIFYVRLANGCIVPLPKHHIDTGMGFERLVALLQEKKSNYDTDLFQPLFNAIQKCSNAPEYRGTFGDEDAGKIDYGYRILADHARMVTVALSDNMLPEQKYGF